MQTSQAVRRLVATIAAVLVATVVAGCGQTFDNLATGTFDGSKLIALNTWVGGNSVGSTIEAYADVPDDTPGILDISGPQHLRCVGAFRVPSYVPAPGGLFESDQDRKRDQVVKLPSFVLSGMTGEGVGFLGPNGRYRITIEVSSPPAKFSHSWEFGGGGNDPMGLYEHNSACTQLVETLALQQALADHYLAALQGVLSSATSNTRDYKTPSTIRTQLQALLDQARQAEVSGDGQTDPAQRTADYQSAAAILTKMVQLAADSAPSPNPPWELAPADKANITKLGSGAAALLSMTGLR
jgi:hypothetical protein